MRTEIVARFQTGTTIDDPAEGANHCVKLLLDKLKENHTAGRAQDGELFSVEIERVDSECLR